MPPNINVQIVVAQVIMSMAQSARKWVRDEPHVSYLTKTIGQISLDADRVRMTSQNLKHKRRLATINCCSVIVIMPRAVDAPGY